MIKNIPVFYDIWENVTGTSILGIIRQKHVKRLKKYICLFSRNLTYSY